LDRDPHKPKDWLMYKLLLCQRYLRTRYIALASIISVTLGVATMIVVNAVMAGFSSEMRMRIQGILSDIIIETRNYDGELNAELHKRVISQDQAITQVCKAVRRSRSGLKDPKRPTGAFLFCGPTGVGKTLLAKTLAEFMFGDEDALIQIDMSEYMEKHNVSRLIGAPPGYVGFEEGGQLTEKIRRRPYAVVLLDEIEKAHPDVYNMLLQIMEEGHLTDSFGRRVDFKNVILIMTTNAGATRMAHGGSMGLHTLRERDQERSYDDMKTNLMHELQKQFKPEFLGRLDEVVVFRKLTRVELMSIVDIELRKVFERLRERGKKLILTDEARGFIIDKGEAGDGLDYGARPLRRSVEKYIEDPLSEELLRGTFDGQNLIRVGVKEVGDLKQLTFEGGMDDTPAAEAETAAAPA